MMPVSSLAICATLLLAGQKQEDGSAKTYEDFGAAHQMIFFSVLEGLYEDGVTTDEVHRILMKRPEHGYEHFIYSCPLCTAAFQAFEVYLNRPDWSMYKASGIKTHHRPYNATFGEGLSEDARQGLASGDTAVRIKTIFDMVRNWVTRRMSKMNLNTDEKNTIMEEIRDGRLKGMKALEGFRKKPESMKVFAPGYVNLREYAICNASSNMKFFN